jgi:protein-L-isoaspartate(D-aspartate) O-methyltransferase
MSWAVWITGLPGSGKSVIARAAARALRARGREPVVLELDEIRQAITPSPTYTDDEREAVYRALVYIGSVLVAAGIPVIFDATAHRRAWRELARASLPAFAEVQLTCPLDLCRRREADRPRGHAPADIYAKSARPGARVPGVNLGYELARAPELTLDTAAETVETAAAAIVALITARFPAGAAAAPAGDAGARLLLDAGSPEQREISRHARAYASRRLRQARARGSAAGFAEERRRMVEDQIAARGVTDARVLEAMRQVPREAFVPDHLARRACEDGPLPIGEGQTISQPYIVAVMTEALRLGAGNRVLEIGTGSGYGAAVLATLAAEVYTIERLARLAAAARQRLRDLGYANVHVLAGDGSRGWPEHAPYDAIVVTAGGPEVPPSLLRQLAVGGRLVMPVGPTMRHQRLVRIVRAAQERVERDELEEVAFVPLIGAEGWPAEEAAVR